MIYEVHLAIRSERSAEWQIWLRTHIDEMLKIQGFERAEWGRVIEGSTASQSEEEWVVHYFVATQEHLEAYIRVHAERMRAHGLNRFGDDLRAWRRVVKLTPSSRPDHS